MTAEIRRGIVERVMTRLEARGAAFERDPQILAHDEESIDGKIEMQELRARYTEFARSRLKNGAGAPKDEWPAASP